MRHCYIALAFIAAALPARADAGQKQAARPASALAPAAPAAVPTDPAAGFVVGPDDVLSIVFWHDKDMSTDVTVRPDGKISLPLLNDIQAAGLTPADLRARLTDDARRYFENPSVTVVVKQVNSRKAFITGQIVKPGPYALTAPTTVLQLIAMAGGLKDYADGKNIMIVRYENGQRSSYTLTTKTSAGTSSRTSS